MNKNASFLDFYFDYESICKISHCGNDYNKLCAKMLKIFID